MNKERQEITRQTVDRMTFRRQKQVSEMLKTADIMSEDRYRNDRMKVSKCRWCYYTRQLAIVGHAFTHRPCALCPAVITSSNTDCDVLCSDCARKHKLCSKCGADVDLRSKRRSFKFEGVSENVGTC